MPCWLESGVVNYSSCIQQINMLTSRIVSHTPSPSLSFAKSSLLKVSNGSPVLRFTARVTVTFRRIRTVVFPGNWTAVILQSILTQASSDQLIGNLMHSTSGSIVLHIHSNDAVCAHPIRLVLTLISDTVVLFSAIKKSSASCTY